MLKSARNPTSRHSQRNRLLLSAVVGTIFLGFTSSGWAALSAQLDRNTVKDGDTVTLTLERSGAQSGDQPDLKPLRRDFNVLGTSTSSEIGVMNGTRSDRTSWSIQLQPRHVGTLDVPAIAVGGEVSVPLKLTVTKTSPQTAMRMSKHAFLEVETGASSKAIYVQQQIPYTVRLFYDESVRDGDLAAPTSESAIVEQLGEDKHFAAVRNGRQYNVVERRYAISPERSGSLRVLPASFSGNLAVEGSRNGQSGGEDLLSRLFQGSPFGNDPFFKNSFAASELFGARTQPVSFRGQEIELSVLPRPPGAKGNWLPAENITLHDSWESTPPEFRVGEPVTRVITITAKGLAASQIPPLSLAKPENARQYPEAAVNKNWTDGDKIYGSSEQKMTYIPTAQGTLNIQPVDLDWWNTITNVQSSAQLPAREFKIDAGVAGVQSNAPLTASILAVPQSSLASAASLEPHPLGSMSLGERLKDANAWLLGGAAILAMIVMVIIARLRGRRGKNQSSEAVALAVPEPRRSIALRALRQACEINNAQSAKDALLAMARAKWPDNPPRSLGALATRLDSGVIEVEALDQYLYGGGKAIWEGHELWGAIRHGLVPTRQALVREREDLKPLYSQ